MMWTDDDRVNPSRWQRLRHRVAATDEDRLMRWVLLVNVLLVSVWILVSVVIALAQGVATLVGSCPDRGLSDRRRELRLQATRRSGCGAVLRPRHGCRRRADLSVLPPGGGLQSVLGAPDHRGVAGDRAHARGGTSSAPAPRRTPWRSARSTHENPTARENEP